MTVAPTSPSAGSSQSRWDQPSKLSMSSTRNALAHWVSTRFLCTVGEWAM